MNTKKPGLKRAFYLSEQLNQRLNKAAKEYKLSELAEQALDQKLREKGL